MEVLTVRLDEQTEVALACVLHRQPAASHSSPQDRRSDEPFHSIRPPHPAGLKPPVLPRPLRTALRPLLSDHRIVGPGPWSTDSQRARIDPLLPDLNPRRGGQWRDHRQVIDAIPFKYRTDTPWMDMAERFGSWKGAHNRLRKWAADGNVKWSSPPCSPRPTPKATSTGSSRSTPPSCAHTSTPPGPVERGPTGEPDDDALPAMIRAGRRRGTSINVLRVQESPKARPERSTTTV
ncbi:transposase [Streptomyces sp. NPDC047829]|uniref:transposase n=1 Tax=Streptomyces sp. NPDC047829 TaxID=3154609 RepID=UPI0033D95FB5